MGLFFRRRRPVMRLAAGAAVAGTAHQAGKERTERREAHDQAHQAYAATQGSPARDREGEGARRLPPPGAS